MAGLEAAAHAPPPAPIARAARALRALRAARAVRARAARAACTARTARVPLASAHTSARSSLCAVAVPLELVSHIRSSRLQTSTGSNELSGCQLGLHPC